MSTPSPAEARLSDRPARTALRTVKLLAGGYLGISVLTLAAIVLLRDDTALVDDAVWIRGTIVAASSLLTFVFAVRANRGSRRAHLRIRIISAVMLLAIVVIVALPGTFPLWLKIEQSVCGLVLLGIAVLVNGRRLRSSFANELPRESDRKPLKQS